MVTKFTTLNLETRKVELEDEIKKITDVTEPLRAARDKFVQDHDIERKRLNDELKAAEEGLFDLRTEQGRIARALGGKSLKVINN